MSLRLSCASGLVPSLGQCSRALPLRPPSAASLLSSSSTASASASSSPSVSAHPVSRPFHTSGSFRAAAAAEFAGRLSLPADYVPPTQPPSARRPDFHKAQLLRTYTSLLRSTPLMLIFQHNNLTGPEWTALRRELVLALRNASEQQAGQWPVDFDAHIRLQVVRSRMLNLALKVTEFFDPVASASASASAAAGAPKTYSHDLSVAALDTVKKAEADGLTAPDRSVYGQLAPLLVGPLALLTFPAVSPAHLAAALSVLAPAAPAFPPPSRKKSPGYYEPAVQSALQKLLLVGGRVEGKAMDTPALHWVGALGVTGGLAGLQAQLVALLQSAGMGLTSTLEGTSKSLWLTMDSRRTMLEEPSAAQDTA